MASLRASQIAKYECPVCCGHGEIEVHAGGLPWYEDCKNCNGIGKCDWIRNAMPLVPRWKVSKIVWVGE